MKTIFLNDLRTSLGQRATQIALLAFLLLGLVAGQKFNISISDALAANAAYSVGFMIGMLSLMLILIATVLAFSLLFKEQDARFGLIVFATPIPQKAFALARFTSFYGLTLFGFFFLVLGYALGLQFQDRAAMNPGFRSWHFIYPFLLFGVVNTALVCAMLFAVAQGFRSKLLVALTGLLLYVLYMIALMFSNAPFMAQALPQSITAQRISAVVDLFGLSGYFFEGRNLNVWERNHQIVPLARLLLLNRLLILALSAAFVGLGMHAFSFLPRFKGKAKKQKPFAKGQIHASGAFSTAATLFSLRTQIGALGSFVRIDLRYLFKSIALVAVAGLLLFYVGVELYDDINKGIRLPQFYASSGLLAQSLNATFFALGGLVVVYFVNDIFWRARSSGFSIIENTTFYAAQKRLGHMGSITVLLLFLTALLLLEAVIYQIAFGYPIFDLKAYWGVVVFNTLPLLLLAFFLLGLNGLFPNKAVALGVSVGFFMLMATPISRGILTNSLFRFLSGYKGPYSDFLGYGLYLHLFLWRLAFGFALVGVWLVGIHTFQRRRLNGLRATALAAFALLALGSGYRYLEHYQPKNEDGEKAQRAAYEQRYRNYQHIAQPTIKAVTARVDLYPKERSYRIQGTYQIKNLKNRPMDSLLIQVPQEMQIALMTYAYHGDTLAVKNTVSELHLPRPIQPGDSAQLQFMLRYHWDPVNGHDPFNAIVENGSFMRISRYFPQLGYDADRELTDSVTRKEFKLGPPTPLKPLDAPRERSDDFIRLTLDISTPTDQVAVGTGQLEKQWNENGRTVYRYGAEAIPFRFAISAARYAQKTVEYKGVAITVLYHPLHAHNVDHLMANTKRTLAYCIQNFGPYPFTSVRFAEVSSFTQGFAGTAYPGVIFMTENMTFNANLQGGKNQDVINELAGHEVSHFWWGNNQIDPDMREGYAMLTESLAMYTELMIYKQLYGVKKMHQRLAIQQQIYDAQKGFGQATPLIKATKAQLYVAYAKGAITFVNLSELIGEKNLNQILKRFVARYKYPHAKPIATDLLQEILSGTDPSYHTEIKAMFE